MVSKSPNFGGSTVTSERVSVCRRRAYDTGSAEMALFVTPKKRKPWLLRPRMHLKPPGTLTYSMKIQF